MSHLSGRCTCGRTIHLPKGASIGDTWTCHNCGRTWHVMPHGPNPLHSRNSKPPSENPSDSSFSPCSEAPSGDWETTALVVGGVAALICAPTLCLLGAGLAGGLWAWKRFG